jgi:hypothetical protein
VASFAVRAPLLIGGGVGCVPELPSSRTLLAGSIPVTSTDLYPVKNTGSAYLPTFQFLTRDISHTNVPETFFYKAPHGESAHHIPGMNLELSDEQAAALAKELTAIIDGDRYFLSPRIRTLREIRNMICPEPKREPLPEPKHLGAAARTITAATVL